jgi:ABC-type lipoprotein release transport system permease subunit
LLTFVLGAEVTMSCVLLILSGLVVKGALGTVQLVGAFPIDDVLTGRFVLESYDYETVEHRSSFYDALVPLTLLLGATGAALLPALRASMIDPVTALRAE